MRRFIVLLALVLGALLPATSSTRAQNPGALDYSALNVIVTDEGFLAPDSIPSGRYLVTLVNQGTLDYNLDIIGLGEGAPPLDELFAEPDSAEATEEESEEIPDWLIFNGGIASVAPGRTAHVIQDLEAGDYFFFTYLNEDFGRPLVVTEGDDPSTAPLPETEGVISLSETSTTLPDRIASGQHVYAVENQSQYPLYLQLFAVPAELTLEQLQIAVDWDGEGPMPAGLEAYNEGQFYAAGGIGALPAGATLWIVLDLESGQYGAMTIVATGDEEFEHPNGAQVLFTVE